MRSKRSRLPRCIFHGFFYVQRAFRPNLKRMTESVRCWRAQNVLVRSVVKGTLKMQKPKKNIIKLCDLKPDKDAKGSWGRNQLVRIASNRRLMSGDYGRRLH